MRAPQRSTSCAFTLMELLVVIAIIGILASLILAGLARASASVKSVKCKGNVRQLMLATTLYVADNDAYPMTMPTQITGQPPAHWWALLAPYRITGAHDRTRNLVVLNPAGLNCPSAKYEFVTTNSASMAADYGYNDAGAEWTDEPGFGLGFTGARTLPTPGEAPRSVYAPVRDSFVASPADMIGFADAFMKLSKPKKILDATTSLSGISNKMFDRTSRMSIGYALASKRHGGSLNTGFCDGHVESIKVDRLFFDDSPAARARWHRDNKPHAELALRK